MQASPAGLPAPCRPALPRRGPHGTKGDAITHALAKKVARLGKVQRWTCHKDSRTTQELQQAQRAPGQQPGYGIGANLAGALAHDAS